MKTPGTFLWIYGMPIVLAIAGCVGLAAALFADGVWDWVSWLALGAMTAAGLWYALIPAASPAERRVSRSLARPPADRAARR
ncbi:hypothetical protein [Cupriavidus gilardii]|uniref:hypothetical protein n=1 Tax=Cupriavidus gilardii TaxID=82541 RepID=UPI0015807ADC|nr:hypothetical protein [Cupriavidus gilardii]MCT9074139.1 hypothetical protein [Cupriavidus gilardii]QKS61791.1 hypothetical protein FOB47_08125 [Cupriavidus gilardii]